MSFYSWLRVFLGYALVALAIAAVIHISDIPWQYVLRGLRPPLLVILILTVGLHFFMTEGRIIFQIWFIKITWEGGVLRGLMMGTRLILLIVGTSMLTLTTSPIQLTDGIESLLKPGKKNRYPRPRAGHDDDHCAAFHSHPFGRNGKK